MRGFPGLSDSVETGVSGGAGDRGDAEHQAFLNSPLRSNLSVRGHPAVGNEQGPSQGEDPYEGSCISVWLLHLESEISMTRLTKQCLKCRV